jgi:MFS family permease
MTLFLAATGMTTLAVAGTAPILPLLQAHFSYVGNAALLSRATITIGCIGIVVGAPLTAFAAARLGRKPLLVGSALVFTIAGCCGFVVDNLYVIVASRFLVGATSALVTTLTATIVAESYDEAGRNRWMGIMVGVGTLFAMALLPLAGVLGDMDWRECFLLHLIGAPVMILAWLGYQSPDTIRTAARTNAGGRASIRLDLIALGLCAGIAINAQSVYAPFKLYAMGVRSAALIGVSLMPLTLFAAFTSPFYGKLRTRASAALAFGLGFGGLALGLAIFIYAPTWTVALCGYALFGAALGITLSNLYAVASEALDPDHRGAFLGQALAAYYAAPLLAQMVLEPLIGGRPVLALIWLTSFCCLISIASFAAVLRSSRASARAA